MRGKKLYKIAKKGLAIGTVLVMIFAWSLSTLRLPLLNFPPQVQEVGAVEVTVVLTTGTANPWVIPSDWGDTNTIHLVGGGGGGGGGGSGGGQDPAAGGGGGAYSVITDLDLNFGDADVDYFRGA